MRTYKIVTLTILIIAENNLSRWNKNLNVKMTDNCCFELNDFNADRCMHTLLAYCKQSTHRSMCYSLLKAHCLCAAVCLLN